MTLIKAVLNACIAYQSLTLTDHLDPDFDI